MTLGKMNWQNLAAYMVQPSDMELFQTYMTSMLSSVLGGTRTYGIISGGKISIVSGMQAKISSGVAMFPDGQLVTFPELNFTVPAANSTNPRIDRIELSYLTTNNTTVVDINSNNLILDKVYVPSINVVQGTAGATPVAPGQTSSNISLGLISTIAGQSQLLDTNVSQVTDVSFIPSKMKIGSSFIRFNQSSSLLEFSNDGVRYSSFGSGGGGGAGGGASWAGVEGVSPIEAIEYGAKALLFSQGASQACCYLVKVPSSYVQGTQIKMKLTHYSPSSSNSFKFKTTSSLIKKGVDSINSSANIYNSTNSEVSNSSSFKNIEIQYDLSASNGSVGSVAIESGDLVLVTLTRVATLSTEDTEDVRMLPSTTELIFS